MSAGNNAARILEALDGHLDSAVELTLYGRAALQLGFADPLDEFAFSRDIDAVFWLGQAEELAESTNFWNRRFWGEFHVFSPLFVTPVFRFATVDRSAPKSSKVSCGVCLMVATWRRI